jgi:hypothetical protein
MPCSRYASRTGMSEDDRRKLSELSELIDDARAQLGVSVDADAHQVRLIERDGRAVVLLTDDVVAYVPRDPIMRFKLQSERNVLERIASRLSFAVPRPLGNFNAFDFRMNVRGATGIEFQQRAIANNPDGFASWMAKGLAEIHTAISSTDIWNLHLSAPDWPMDHARLRVGIDQHLEEGSAIRERAHAVADRWRDCDRSRGYGLLHGDFGGHNFVFDPESAMPIGLLDFLDHGQGSRLYDLKFLPSYEPSVCSRVLSEYSERTKIAIDRQELALFHAATAISYLAWRAQDPVAHDGQSGRNREQAIAWATRAVQACFDAPSTSLQ